MQSVNIADRVDTLKAANVLADNALKLLEQSDSFLAAAGHIIKCIEEIPFEDGGNVGKRVGVSRVR